MSSRRTSQQKLALFEAAFRGRDDIHGTRDRHLGKARCVKAPPDVKVLGDHLRGKQPVGIYPLVKEKVWFAAIDLDDPDPGPVLTLCQLAQELGLEPLIERSKSKGWHLWWFADKAGWRAATIRRLLRWMTAEVNRPEVEVFPKQDRLSPGGFGNFIFLPLDGRLVPKARTLFVQPTRWLPPVENQWDVLAGRQRCSEARISEVISSAGIEHKPFGAQVSNRAITPTVTTRRSAPCPRGDPLPQNAVIVEHVHADSSGWGLPPCARRMLAEGVTEHQRVACFRLAVHLHRLGIPEDIAITALRAWAEKNRPSGGKRVITDDEITEQTNCAYTGRYRGYGCEDPQIARYCNEQCPVRLGAALRATHHRDHTLSR